jgi:hypothetical protein
VCYSVSTSTALPNTSYNKSEWTPRGTSSSIVHNACLQVHYLAMSIHVTVFNVEYIYTGYHNDRNK